MTTEDPDITAFITTALDFLAGIARPATGGSWSAPEIPALAPGGYPRWRVDIVMGELQSPQGIADCLVSHADAEHIAAWDPPRVFEHINAMRRVLARHVPYDDYTFGPRCRVCASGDAYSNGVAVMEPWPCPTVRELAAPYAGAPGFKAEWRIEP